MLEYLRKQRAQSPAQEAGAEHTAHPAGMSNQAVLSMLDGQNERQPARPSSGGQPLADAMRAKFERQFGLPMDQVRVHRNSDQPAKFDAKAYAYGSDIFLGPGHEDSLEHEITHVAQQMMGQVRPTGMENGLAVNYSPVLEHSADVGAVPQTMGTAVGPVVQCDKKDREDRANFKHWKSSINKLIKAKMQLDDSSTSKEKKDSAQKLWDDNRNMHQQVEAVMRARRLFTQANYVGGSFSAPESLIARFAADLSAGSTMFDLLDSTPTPDLLMGSLYFGGTNHLEPTPNGATEDEIESGTEGGRMRLFHWLGPRLEFSSRIFRHNKISEDNDTVLVEYFGDERDDRGNRIVHPSRGALLSRGRSKIMDEEMKRLIDAITYAQYELSQNPNDDWIDIVEPILDNDSEVMERISRANSFLSSYMKKHNLLSFFNLQPADPDKTQAEELKEKHKKACVIQ